MEFQIELNNVTFDIKQDKEMKRFFDIFFNDSYQRISVDNSGNWHYAERRDLEKKTEPLPLQSLGEAIAKYLTDLQ